jgi:hypothetical protein
MSYLADDSAAIKARLEELMAEKQLALTGSSAPVTEKVLELKAAFKGIEGSETLTMRYAPNGNQILIIGDKEIEVGPMASNDEIRLALENPFIKTENTKMSIADDLKAARARLQQARQGAASAVAESASVAGLVLEEIAKVEKETEEMRAEIAGLNGGPA